MSHEPTDYFGKKKSIEPTEAAKPYYLSNPYDNMGPYYHIPLTPPPPPPKENHKGLLFVIIGLLCLVTMLFGVLLFVIFSQHYSVALTAAPTTIPTPTPNISTPEKTLQTYCMDFETGNAQGMYDLLSTRNQQRSSVNSIQHIMNTANTTLGGVTDCHATSIQESGSTAVAIVSFTFGDGKTARERDTLVLENGIWKFDSSQAIQ